MSADLTGHRIVVTGGATGLGAAISRILCDSGANVVVVQRTARDLEEALNTSGLVGKVVGLVADLTVAHECAAVIREASAILGGLDGLVNNAAMTGPPAHRTVLEMDDLYIDRLIDLNLKAAVRCSVAAAPHLVAAGGGTIVSISSVLAHAPAPAGALYSASKAGLVGFTRGLALELGSKGVRAVCVSPGDIDTSSSVAPEAPAGLRAVRTPALNRRGAPFEVASVVAFLMSSDANYVTGIDVVVDGGFLLG